MINSTFVFNPIRYDLIEKALKSLYKFTDMQDNRVIVIDQTKNGLFEEWGIWSNIRPFIHLYIRPYRNLGFSKSMNEGIIHGLRWNSKYIVCANDDIEFIDSRWWNGILETFSQDEKIMAVNPMSVREPGWGYGLDHGIYIDLLPYKEFTKEDYDYLLNGDFSNLDEKLPKTFPRKKTGVIDAIATWCTIFKKESFEKFGLFEERYYPGGGEDYDMNARIYREGYRAVGTTKSWVWHWWGSSKDTQEHLTQSLPIKKELCWMNPDLLWPKEKNLSWNKETQQMEPKEYDPWGKVTLKDGSKSPMYRDKTIGIVDM